MHTADASKCKNIQTHTEFQTFESVCVKTHAAVKFTLQEGEFSLFVETILEVSIQQYHYLLS